jgi:hypothetical protein
MLKFRIDRSSRQTNTRISLAESNLAVDGHRVSDLDGAMSGSHIFHTP